MLSIKDRKQRQLAKAKVDAKEAEYRDLHRALRSTSVGTQVTYIGYMEDGGVCIGYMGDGGVQVTYIGYMGDGGVQVTYIPALQVTYIPALQVTYIPALLDVNFTNRLFL